MSGPSPSPDPAGRTPRDIIDQALSENRLSAGLCYFLVLLFSLAGVAALAWGAWNGEGLVALAGSLSSSLFWPALSNARAIRAENVAIRLLELTLANAKTADEAANALKDAFQVHFTGKGGKTKGG
jgi:hypothetical protein